MLTETATEEGEGATEKRWTLTMHNVGIQVRSFVVTAMVDLQVAV